jgi:hypothetical protein
MELPKVFKILGTTSVHSELSIEPEKELFEGSKLEPDGVESDESKEEGDREVVM